MSDETTNETTNDIPADIDAAALDQAIAIEPPPSKTPEWGVLDDERVVDVLTTVAAKVGRDYGHVTTPDDMHQEGAIWLALNHETVNELLSDEQLGARALFRRLHSRLVDGVRPDAAHAASTVQLNDAAEFSAT